VQYGYLESWVLNNGSEILDGDKDIMISAALADFQRFVGIEATG
jgi:hypothetical protein